MKDETRGALGDCWAKTLLISEERSRFSAVGLPLEEVKELTLATGTSFYIPLGNLPGELHDGELAVAARNLFGKGCIDTKTREVDAA